MKIWDCIVEVAVAGRVGELGAPTLYLDIRLLYYIYICIYVPRYIYIYLGTFALIAYT